MQLSQNGPLYVSGFPWALENREKHEKSSMHGKIMEFEKTSIIMEFFELIWQNHR